MTELPDRIDASRRQQLNDDLTLAVGQGRIDLAEFSDLVDHGRGAVRPARASHPRRT